MTTLSKAGVLFVMILICGIPVEVAHAHGEIAGSNPQAGAVLPKVPLEVSVTYSETPAASSRFVVKDGCGDDVTAAVDVQGKSLVAEVSAAKPGTWTVTWDVLSAEDGHETHGSISFKVRSKPDCSDGGVKSPGGTTRSAPTPDEPQSFPVVVIVVGILGVLLVVIALLVRRSTGGG